MWTKRKVPRAAELLAQAAFKALPCGHLEVAACLFMWGFECGSLAGRGAAGTARRCLFLRRFPFLPLR